MKRRPVLILLACIGVLTAMGTTLAFLRPSTGQWPHLSTLRSPSEGLDLRFLGTSSLSLSDGKDRLLIDGYFSRPGVLTLLTQGLEPNPARIDHALDRAQIDQVSALLVAHSHFDHALDALPIAKQFNARLMGGETLDQIARRHPANLAVEAFSPPQTVQVGAFSITPFLTPHAPGDVAKGATASGFTHPAKASDWPLGEAYSWLIEHEQCRILIVPSAGEIGRTFADVKADIVLLGIGQLAKLGPSGLEAYWRDTVIETGAGLVIPIHWDDFTRPLSQPLKPLPYVIDRFDLTMQGLTRLAQRDQVTLGLAPVFSRLDLGRYSPACA